APAASASGPHAIGRARITTRYPRIIDPTRRVRQRPLMANHVPSTRSRGGGDPRAGTSHRSSEPAHPAIGERATGPDRSGAADLGHGAPLRSALMIVGDEATDGGVATGGDAGNGSASARAVAQSPQPWWWTSWLPRGAIRAPRIARSKMRCA